MIKTEIEEKKIRKEVKKIRIKVTLALIIFTVTLILSTLQLVNLLRDVHLFYFIGVIFGFVGLIARSISMWKYIDHKMMIHDYNIKYRWYKVSEQRKIIYWAYFFKYPIFIIPTILAFVSFVILTLDKFFNQPFVSLILISGVSMVVGFILKWPKGIS